MVERVGKSGTSHSFALDVGWILAEEARDPTYSFFKDLEVIADNPRLTLVARMAQAMGEDFAQICKEFSIFELVEIFAECCKESGFIPSE